MQAGEEVTCSNLLEVLRYLDKTISSSWQ